MLLSLLLHPLSNRDLSTGLSALSDSNLSTGLSPPNTAQREHALKCGSDRLTLAKKLRPRPPSESAPRLVHLLTRQRPLHSTPTLFSWQGSGHVKRTSPPLSVGCDGCSQDRRTFFLTLLKLIWGAFQPPGTVERTRLSNDHGHAASRTQLKQSQRTRSWERGLKDIRVAANTPLHA